MNYFEQNIEYLKLYNSNLHTLMYESDYCEPKNKTEKVYSDAANNGEKILFLQKDSTLYRLNSSFNPSHEAKIWAEQFELNNISTTIAMFGLGNGLFATKLANRLSKEDFLFVYEPCKEIFDYVMNHFDLKDLLINKNVILIVEGVNDFDFHSIMQCVVNITNMYSQIQCSHPYYNELFEDSCVMYWREIRDTLVHTRINVNTEIIFGERKITNGLANLQYLKNSCTLEDFKQDINKDIPVIIVAAGPSLGENIEELKKAKGKAYIIVVDRILDYILDQGVEPDFISTVDPKKPLEYFTTREDVAIPLLTEFVSNWEVLDRHKGKKIFYNCGPYFNKMYQAADIKPPSLLTGASVATVSFSTCLQLGFNKIVLVGQDLAFDGEFTHAGGVAEKIRSESHVIMVEGVDGSQVRSRYDWKEFLIWFKDMIHMNPEVMVIDTKKKGAKIQGSVSMSLSEVIEKYGAKEKQTIDQVLNENRFTFDDTSFKKVLKFLNNSIDELSSLKRKAKEALELCDQQIREFTRHEEDTDITIKNFKRISKINKYIEKLPSYYLVDSYILSLASADLSTLYQYNENLQETKIDTYTKSKKIYEATIKGVEFSLPKLRDVLEKIDK